MSKLRHEAIMNETWTRSWQQNRICLMVKDAATLFVYWEVDRIHRNLVSEHLQRPWGELSCFLRLNDVTLLDYDGWNCPSSHKIVVHPEADNWYINGLTPVSRYVVDFGVDTPAGQFLALLRSNVVQMPPAKPLHKVEPLLRFSPPAQSYNSNPQDLDLPSVEEPAWQISFDGYSLVSDKGGISNG